MPQALSPTKKRAAIKRNRQMISAHKAAQRELARKYPKVFARLYEAEKAKRGLVNGN